MEKTGKKNKIIYSLNFDKNIIIIYKENIKLTEVIVLSGKKEFLISITVLLKGDKLKDFEEFDKRKNEIKEIFEKKFKLVHESYSVLTFKFKRGEIEREKKKLKKLRKKEQKLNFKGRINSYLLSEGGSIILFGDIDQISGRIINWGPCMLRTGLFQRG